MVVMVSIAEKGSDLRGQCLDMGMLGFSRRWTGRQ
jgi:hypothetical protein